MKFYVEVTRSKKEAVIQSEIDGVQYSTVMKYEEDDEWNSFDFGGNIFDIHFLYDDGFTVSIYPVIDDSVEYCKLDVELKLKRKAK